MDPSALCLTQDMTNRLLAAVKRAVEEAPTSVLMRLQILNEELQSGALGDRSNPVVCLLTRRRSCVCRGRPCFNPTPRDEADG